MFYISRLDVLESLEKTRENVCAYFGNRCDCKFGGQEKIFGSENKTFVPSEQTGCPELRCVIFMLRMMSDQEYLDIMDRQENWQM